jgi:hypothetical protein
MDPSTIRRRLMHRQNFLRVFVRFNKIVIVKISLKIRLGACVLRSPWDLNGIHILIIFIHRFIPIRVLSGSSTASRPSIFDQIPIPPILWSRQILRASPGPVFPSLSLSLCTRLQWNLLFFIIELPESWLKSFPHGGSTMTLCFPHGPAFPSTANTRQIPSILLKTRA